LILPVLALLLFGLIALGFVFAAQITLNNSARDASRAGVVQPLSQPPLTCQAIALNARSSSATLGVQPIQVGVTVTGPGGTTCSLPSGSSTASGSSTSTPCTGASAGALNVAMTYNM
jgi:Flp pilus assembly protein TadG